MPECCRSCGAEGPLALISDPFLDACYGWCQSCMSQAWVALARPHPPPAFGEPDRRPGGIGRALWEGEAL